ncbi:MAG: hypothetical protein JXQ73_29415 [Phycisphaerae bacterium]|nr:hypothetical protein [Phycisphaerae bacterium]
MNDPNESMDEPQPEAPPGDEHASEAADASTETSGQDPAPDQTADSPHDGAQQEQAVQDARDSQPPARRDDRPRIIARYGLLGLIGEFTVTKKIAFSRGGKLVLQTDRGIEIGQHVPVQCNGGPGDQVDSEAIRQYLTASGPEYLQRRVGRVLRAASEQDLSEERHINLGAQEELAYCRELILQHELPMDLITCEHLFGGERIIFYFMADGRVDFRQLVRDLARQYQTRIEMRQVGARDEARLVADYEICGRECCCKNFLKTLRPVSMKMAKMQKATLDPSKVSGRCGRLRCCLRYEHEVYDELNKRLPRNNTWVRTPDGEGKVVDRQVITQLLTIELESQRRVSYPFEEVEVLGQRPPQPTPPPAGGRGEPADRNDKSTDLDDRSRRRGPRRRLRDASDRPGESGPPAESKEAAPAPQDTSPAPSTEPRQAGPQDRSSNGNADKASDGSKESGKKRRRRRRRRPPRRDGNGGGTADGSSQQNGGND